MTVQEMREKYASKHYRKGPSGEWEWVTVPGEVDILDKNSPGSFKDVSGLPAKREPVVYREPLSKLKSENKSQKILKGQKTKHRGESSIPAWEQAAIQELEDLMDAKAAGIISQREYNEELDEIREMYDI